MVSLGEKKLGNAVVFSGLSGYVPSGVIATPPEPIPENSIYMMLKRREEKRSLDNTYPTKLLPTRRW